jgi:ADP-ribosylglycohydrolase
MDLETYAYPHILGGLYGHALGDAWGMAAYLRPSQTWSYYNGWLETLVDAPPDHPIHAGLKAGQVTDDTQQAMALANAIIRDDSISVEGTAQAILAWYDEIDGDNSPYVGPSTRRAVQALRTGADPHYTGLRGDTNGSAMRITPIGLIHPGNPEAAIEDAVIACTPTHYTDVAVSGACAVAAAIAQALVPNTTLEEILQVAIWAADVGLQRGAPWMGASVARKIDFAVQLATDANISEGDRIQNLYDLVGSSLAVADSVPCAFGILAMAEGDPVETAIYAAALSGDADTVGAIACAIAGAWHTVDAIPMQYIETLRQANPQYDLALRNHSVTPEVGQDLLEAIRKESNEEK